MMLDSSIGKILSTTKPVEPSIPGNSDEPETKDDSAANPTKSEAEVRIVFRFFVEEQIVYNGKIEQVKQLESEELSRIVSRIAWDGAKDQKKPILDRDPIKNDEITSGKEDKAEKADSTDINSSETLKEVSYEASDIEYTTKDDCDTSLECTVPTEAVKTINIDKDSLTHITRLTPENPARNDAPTPPYSYHICETDLKLNSSYNAQEKDKHQPTINVQDQSYQDKLSSNEAPSSSINDSHIDDDDTAAAAAAAAESQMIVEALYDCVYNVDLESRKSDLASSVKNEFVSLEQTQQTGLDESNEATQIRHNEVGIDASKEVAKVDKKPLMEAANVPPNQDITQETIPNNDDSYLKNKGARSLQACKDDLNLRTDPTKKSDIILTSRRRNTCDIATTNRRIRRSGSKDLRASRISSTDRQRENSAHNDVMAEDSDNPRQHFAHQSKVFAKWSDNHFYPGTILKSARDRKFEIGFCDGARKDVVETDLIPLSNILHKQVRVSIAKDYCVNAIVHEQVLNNGQPMFDVSYQQNGPVRKCVPLRDIFLTAEQGIQLINQPIRPDKNPDESMFAGVDLDNIVHNKRSRRLQEMEDLEMSGEGGLGQPSNTPHVSSRKKRGQYNTRTSTNRARSGNSKTETPVDRGLKRSHSDVNNQDTPISSCSPDNIKPHLHSSNSNPPSESSSSTGSSNSAANGHEIGQEFYFESTSPHRTKASLLS
uniref:Tudor domain-containing protein n=1 Tax=Aceria tosichella TaxID=561515 RepID=A0A6G1SHJ1_9ACAR